MDRGPSGMQSMCGHKESDMSEQLSTHIPSKARGWDWLFCMFHLIFFHHPYEQVIIIAFYNEKVRLRFITRLA